jgi:tRNA (mo5U34)-methyltransferase
MGINNLDLVKSQQWFYEFALPDGSFTNSYLPDFVRPIHHTREKALLLFLNEYGKNGTLKNALDISCHEGYYTLLLAKYFEEVIGIDKNSGSLEKAKLITSVLENNNITYVRTAIEDWEDEKTADFVLCFGLLYHIP